jgi:hypothetical protein
VVGSSTSQTIDSVVSAKKGSMQAVAGSGIRFMSDSLIAFQPAIDEPSNIWPSVNVSSSIIVTSKVTCCHFAARIRETKIDVFYVVVLHHFQDVFGRLHLNTYPFLENILTQQKSHKPD